MRVGLPAVLVKMYEAAQDAKMGDVNAVEVLPRSMCHEGGAKEALWGQQADDLLLDRDGPDGLGPGCQGCTVLIKEHLRAPLTGLSS